MLDPKIIVKCKKCGIDKPQTEYYRASNLRAGHQPDCKSCLAIYRKRYRDQQVDKLVIGAQEKRAAPYQFVDTPGVERPTVSFIEGKVHFSVNFKPGEFDKVRNLLATYQDLIEGLCRLDVPSSSPPTIVARLTKDIPFSEIELDGSYLKE